VIERRDRISDEELIAVLSPEADRYLESLVMKVAESAGSSEALITIFRDR
jgi:hypothetical protein